MTVDVKVGDIVQYEDLYTRVTRIEGDRVWGFWSYHTHLGNPRDYEQRCSLTSDDLRVIKSKQPKLKGIAKFLEETTQ